MREFFLEPGLHDVSLQIDFSKTAPLSIEVIENHRLSLICGPVPWYRMFSSVKLWMRPKELLYLKPKEPKVFSRLVDLDK